VQFAYERRRTLVDKAADDQAESDMTTISLPVLNEINLDLQAGTTTGS
jgi:hypothetical protein